MQRFLYWHFGRFFKVSIFSIATSTFSVHCGSRKKSCLFKKRCYISDPARHYCFVIFWFLPFNLIFLLVTFRIPSCILKSQHLILLSVLIVSLASCLVCCFITSYPFSKVLYLSYFRFLALLIFTTL
jgi:hypothetical protein